MKFYDLITDTKRKFQYLSQLSYNANSLFRFSYTKKKKIIVLSIIRLYYFYFDIAYQFC